MLPIENWIIPISNARSGIKLRKISGVTIHNTGNYAVGATAIAHAKYMGTGALNGFTSYHYVVDDKHICQIIPDNEVAWHAGDGGAGMGNNETISIEICVNPDGDLLKATNNAVELTAYLLNKYHVEMVYQHAHFMDKDCPHEIRMGKPYDWNTFVNKVTEAQKGSKPSTSTSKPSTPKPSAQMYRVRKTWSDSKSQIGAYKDLENAKKACKSGYKVFDNNGKQVYPVKKTVTWDNNAVLKVGDICGAFNLKVSKVDGNKVWIPAVGDGYVDKSIIYRQDGKDKPITAGTIVNFHETKVTSTPANGLLGIYDGLLLKPDKFCKKIVK